MVDCPYTCPTCGIIYLCPRDDPAAGSMCAECAQRAYDAAESIPMSEEEIRKIVDAVTK